MQRSKKIALYLGAVCMSMACLFTTGFAYVENLEKQIFDVKMEITDKIEVKQSANQMADSARKLGFPEESYIIKVAQTHWQEAHEEYVVLREKEDSLNKEAAKAKEQESRGRYLGKFRVSHYADSVQSQGKWVGQTATGVKPTVGRTIAVDPKIIPLGSTVYIDGYGYRTAEDTGGAIKGKRIDMLLSSQSEAMNSGIVYADVFVK